MVMLGTLRVKYYQVLSCKQVLSFLKEKYYCVVSNILEFLNSVLPNSGITYLPAI